MMEVRKSAAWMVASGEAFADYPGLADRVRGVLDGSIVVPPPLPDPGPNPRWEALREAVRPLPHPLSVLTRLVELHRPMAVCYPATIDWVCSGDEYEGRDAEPPHWPCATTAMIATHLGVDVGE